MTTRYAIKLTCVEVDEEGNETGATFDSYLCHVASRNKEEMNGETNYWAQALDENMAETVRYYNYEHSFEYRVPKDAEYYNNTPYEQATNTEEIPF